MNKQSEIDAVDDLTWLAQNVETWTPAAHCWIRTDLSKGYQFVVASHGSSPPDGYYGETDWIAKRQELEGLKINNLTHVDDINVVEIKDDHEQSQHSAEEVVSSILESDSDKPNQFDSTIRMMANENAVETLKGLGYELWGFRWCKPVTDEEWDGEGLPPVGAKLNIHHHDGTVECEIILKTTMAHAEVVIYQTIHDVISWADNPKAFSPIRTPEQLAEEERKAEIDEMLAAIYQAAVKSTVYLNIAKELHKKGYRIAQGEGK